MKVFGRKIYKYCLSVQCRLVVGSHCTDQVRIWFHSISSIIGDLLLQINISFFFTANSTELNLAAAVVCREKQKNLNALSMN